MATTEKAKTIAALRRQMKETKNDVLKNALKKKIERLSADLKAETTSAKELAETLFKQKTEINEMTKSDFNSYIKRLAAKPEYSFLKSMTKSEIKDDLERPAKPVGWRFKGDRTRKPSASEIKKGKKDGSVYYENRRNHSDVVRTAQLKTGGKVSNDLHEERKKMIELLDKANIWNELYLISPDLENMSKQNPTKEYKEKIVNKMMSWQVGPNVHFGLEDLEEALENEGIKYAKGGNLKPIPAGNKGLPKLPKSVRNKMGFMKTGGGVGESISDISLKMYDNGIYQNWVDDVFDYLRMNNPDFTESDYNEICEYAVDGLQETLDENKQTYFHPETLAQGGGVSGLNKAEKKLIDYIKSSNRKMISDINLDTDTKLNLMSLVSKGHLTKKPIKGTQDSEYSIKYATGGEIGEVAKENKEMVMNSNIQIMHHTKELEQALKSVEVVPAWVVAKIYDAAEILSDVTHYLDGESKMEHGGNLKTAKMDFINKKKSGEIPVSMTFEEFSKMRKGGNLIGNQKKLDLNKNGRLDSEDFKMLRGE